MKLNLLLHNKNSLPICQKHFQRLTIEPGLWLAFRGLSSDNIT